MSTSSSTACETAPPATSLLPPYKVLLHNDDINPASFVLDKVIQIGRVEEAQAIEVVKEAHNEGIALLLVTHKERAEFICDQFKTFKITATYEKE